MLGLLLTVFLAGYLFVTAEQFLRISKSATALLTGVALWTVYILGSPDRAVVFDKLKEHVADFSGILFFLMAAMTIVELIDAHDGFGVVTDRMTTRSKRLLLCLVALMTFFLSALLDNLTTTIVMVSLAGKLVTDRKDRVPFIGSIIIAANAGGAWSPIGDVTTTMLWIGGRVSSGGIAASLFMPSLICLALPAAWLALQMKGTVAAYKAETRRSPAIPPFERRLVFIVGIGALLFIPFFKAVTGLPPYMGALLGLAALWIVTEFLHGRRNGNHGEAVSAAAALTKIDLPSILFFLGILLAVSCLDAAGVLIRLAGQLDAVFGNKSAVVFLMGLASSVIDNVPLTAAAMGMYPVGRFPIDHHLWLFFSYCAGTGGSMLIIGSAAGVVAMGMEKITFFDYLRRFSLPALSGYAAGAVWYLATGGYFR
jgi:Na+/H+ antiporter NhaD/arsenite permease-like protein